MPTIQDTFNEAPAKGFPGMVASGETTNRISRTVEDAAGVAFGKFAYRGAGDNGCTGTVGTAATCLGPVMADHGQPVLPGGVAADIVPQYRSATIITQGAVYVTMTGAVNDGDAITEGKGAGAADGLGATAADATHIATGWIADETVGAGQLCRIVRR